MKSQNVYVIADPHFGHKNILKYENRPFADIEHMDNELIKRWNETVSKNDKVFVLGDVSFHDKETTSKIIHKLHGHKILILGNHDRERSVNWWMSVGFKEVYAYPIVYENFTVMSHEPPEYYNDATPFVYIYGHVHSSEMYKTCTKQTACVCVERWNYKPVLLSKVYDMMRIAQ